MSNELLHREYWGILVIVFFIFVITFSYIFRGISLFVNKSTLKKSNDNKVLGGLAVLMVAIVADQTSIYFLSFFIAGLLIASERFMLLLATVFNSDRSNVHKIPSYWPASQSTLDEDDIVEAIGEAGEDLGAAQIEGDTDDHVSDQSKSEHEVRKDEISVKKLSVKKYLNTVSGIETKVANELKKRTGTMQILKQNVFVKTGESAIKYDAIFVEQETNRVMGAFEVKYFAEMKPMNLKAYLRNRAKRFISKDFQVGFIIVFDNYAHSEMDQILKAIKDFEDSENNAFVAVYQNNDFSLQPLYESSLKRNFPSYLEDLW